MLSFCYLMIQMSFVNTAGTRFGILYSFKYWSKCISLFWLFYNTRLLRFFVNSTIIDSNRNSSSSQVMASMGTKFHAGYSLLSMSSSSRVTVSVWASTNHMWRFSTTGNKLARCCYAVHSCDSFFLSTSPHAATRLPQPVQYTGTKKKVFLSFTGKLHHCSSRMFFDRT